MELSSVIKIFADIERDSELVQLSVDEEVLGTEELGLGFKSILARVSKEGVVLVVLVPVETSADFLRRLP